MNNTIIEGCVGDKFLDGRVIDFYPIGSPVVIVQYNHDHRICMTQYSNDWEEDLNHHSIVAATRIFNKYEIVPPKQISDGKES